MPPIFLFNFVYLQKFAIFLTDYMAMSTLNT